MGSIQSVLGGVAEMPQLFQQFPSARFVPRCAGQRQHAATGFGSQRCRPKVDGAAMPAL